MKKTFHFILALIVASPLMAGEVRLLQQEDLQWGDPTTSVASGSATGHPLSNSVKSPPYVDVRDHGATLGTSQSLAVKNANAAAIQAAWTVINASEGGTILIPGVIEVGANVLNFGDNTAHWYGVHVVGFGPDASKIISESTTNVIDLVGRNQFQMRDLTVQSSTAQVGILMGRTAASSNCANNHFENIWVTGTYSISTVVSVAAEVQRFVRCRFWNTGTGSTYWVANKNVTGATSVNGTITTSSNTEINHYGTEFYNTSNGSILIRVSNAATVNFYGGMIIAGLATGSKLVQLDTDDSTWYGPLNFYGTLFEGGGGPAVWFETASMFYYHLNFEGCYFNLYLTGADVFGYKDATVYVDKLKFKGNRLGLYADNVNVQNLVDSEVENYSEGAEIHINANTVVMNSSLKAEVIAWGSGSSAIGATTVSGNDTTYGLHTFGPQPNSNSGDSGGVSRGSTLRFAPQAAPPSTNNKVVGGVYMADTAAWLPQGVNPSGSEPTPVYWDGTQYRGMTPLPSTPASATATCTKGTVAFDNNYVYVCTAENTVRRAAIVGW